MIKKLISVFCVCILTTSLLAGCGQTASDLKDKFSLNQDNSSLIPDNNAEQEDTSNLLSGKYNAEIKVKDYGTIKLELDADTAPRTVTNFVNLAKEGFYDGLTFHRIIDGFMIQGGDPLGNGTGGSDTTIKGEFEANGIKNDISHTRGTISMARSQDYDSASSQFFIVQQDSTYLDDEYAGFGHVTEGMDVVDAICSAMTEKGLSDSIPKEDQPVIESITILE